MVFSQETTHIRWTQVLLKIENMSRSVMFQLEECRVELEEKLKLLTQSAKMIDQLKMQLEASNNDKKKLTKEKDDALRGTYVIWAVFMLL